MGIIGVLKYFFGSAPADPISLEQTISDAASALSEVASTKYTRAKFLRAEAERLLFEATDLEREAAAHDVLAARVQQAVDDAE